MVQPTENREALIHRASEQGAIARTVENGRFCTSNESGVNGNSSTPLCRDFSEPRDSRNSRLQAVLPRSREDRTSDRNQSVQIFRNFGDRNASTVTTTRKFEVLGVKITGN